MTAWNNDRPLVVGRFKTCLMFSSMFALTAGAAGAATADGMAQTPVQVEEVFVTAQRRSENLQQVPIAVTAMTESELQSKAVTQVEDLNYMVPSLNVTRTAASGMIYLRGIGANSVSPGVEPPVAVYVDGVYLGAVLADMGSFNNIDHIEVLKGPQGTLFGRNSTGGLLQIITKDPSSEWGGHARFGYSNFETLANDVYLTGGLGEKVGFNISLYSSEQNRGWGRNVFKGEDVNRRSDYAARLKLVLRPTDTTKITLAADYDKAFDNIGASRQALAGLPPLQGAFAGVTFTGSIYDTNSDVPFYNKLMNDGVSLKVEQDFKTFRIVNIVASRETENNAKYDLDGTPANVSSATYRFNKTDTVSEEFQVLSREEGWLKWIAGLYYFHADAALTPLTVFLTALGPARFQQTYDVQTLNSYAAFAQATMPLFSERTHLTLGVRYTKDEKSIDGTVTTALALLSTAHQTASWSDPTFRVAVDHQFTDTVMGYASFNTGFKSGLFNATSPAAQPVTPEKIKAGEIGLKSELFDRRARLNISAFYYKYDNLQFTAFSGTTIILRNAAAAENYGLELEGNAIVTDHLSISAGASFMHGSYTSFPGGVAFITSPTTGVGVSTIIDESGHKLMRTPSATANIGADYHRTTRFGQFEANLQYAYNSGFFWDPDNQYRQKAYNLVNAELRWVSPDEKYAVRVWGKNLGDTEYLTSVQTANGTPATGSAAEPRTYGMSIEYRF